MNAIKIVTTRDRWIVPRPSVILPNSLLIGCSKNASPTARSIGSRKLPSMYKINDMSAATVTLKAVLFRKTLKSLIIYC